MRPNILLFVLNYCFLALNIIILQIIYELKFWIDYVYSGPVCNYWVSFTCYLCTDLFILTAVDVL